jgi:serine/threonine-protein kinase
LSSRISFSTVLKRLLTLAALVVAFFLSAALVIYFAYGGREVRVPELIGATQADAQSRLEGLGLRMRITTSVPSERIEADRISEQDPRPGVVVKTGQSVRVVVSSGLVPAASLSPAPGSTARPESRKSEDRQGDRKQNNSEKSDKAQKTSRPGN